VLKSRDRDPVFRFLLACSFGSTLIFSQLYGAFPLYLHSAYGLSESLIGLAIAFNPILIVLGQMALTRGVERFPKPRVAAVGTGFLAAGFALLPLGAGFVGAALATVVWTIGEMLYMPTQLTMVSLLAPPGRQGTYQGLNSLAFGLGIVVGPALGLQVLQAGGPQVLWLGLGVLGTIVAIAYLRFDSGLSADPRPADSDSP
jgi:predicted MFS family arabinose efflux permease